MALEELFANVCRYAYPEKDGSGRVHVGYAYNVSPSTVTITDWGTPFDPVAYLDPAHPRSLDEVEGQGMGLMMAHRSVDDMSYVRDGDANVVAFRRAW